MIGAHIEQIDAPSARATTIAGLAEYQGKDCFVLFNFFARPTVVGFGTMFAFRNPPSTAKCGEIVASDA